MGIETHSEFLEAFALAGPAIDLGFVILRSPHSKKSNTFQINITKSSTNRCEGRSYYNPPEPPRQTRHRSRLNELPNELKLNIMETLDPASSACLGLSSRNLYPLHRSVHNKVGLYEQSQGSKVPLAFKLRDWVPKDYALDWQSEKFVKRDRLAALEAERKRERDRYWDERRRLWVWDDDYEERDRDRSGRRHRRRRY